MTSSDVHLQIWTSSPHTTATLQEERAEPGYGVKAVFCDLYVESVRACILTWLSGDSVCGLMHCPYVPIRGDAPRSRARAFCPRSPARKRSARRPLRHALATFLRTRGGAQPSAAFSARGAGRRARRRARGRTTKSESIIENCAQLCKRSHQPVAVRAHLLFRLGTWGGTLSPVVRA